MVSSTFCPSGFPVCGSVPRWTIWTGELIAFGRQPQRKTATDALRQRQIKLMAWLLELVRQTKRTDLIDPLAKHVVKNAKLGAPLCAIELCKQVYDIGRLPLQRTHFAGLLASHTVEINPRIEQREVASQRHSAQTLSPIAKLFADFQFPPKLYAARALAKLRIRLPPALIVVSIGASKYFP